MRSALLDCDRSTLRLNESRYELRLCADKSIHFECRASWHSESLAPRSTVE